MKRLINPAALKRQEGYNHAVVKAGTPVFLSGQVAQDQAGNLVGAGDIDAQLAQIWRNIDAILAEIGAAKADIVKLVTYAVDLAALPRIHAARARYFGDVPRPASTFVVVAGLGDPAWLVEIDVTVMAEPA